MYPKFCMNSTIALMQSTQSSIVYKYKLFISVKVEIYPRVKDKIGLLQQVKWTIIIHLPLSGYVSTFTRIENSYSLFYITHT